MLALLKLLPSVIVLVLGLAGGSLVTGVASWAWLHAIHDPAVRRETTATLTAEVRRSADAAQAAEASRQAQISAATTQQYQEQKAKDDAANAAALDGMQREIDDYERQKQDADKANPAGVQRTAVCGLTQSDLRFLNGLHDH